MPFFPLSFNNYYLLKSDVTLASLRSHCHISTALTDCAYLWQIHFDIWQN